MENLAMDKVRRKAAAESPTFEELAASLPDLEGDWEYLLEGLKVDIALQVTQAMKTAGVSGAELARRMGVEPPMVSRVLRHMGNVQLQTLAKMAAALDLEPVIKLLRKGEEVVVREAFSAKDQQRRILMISIPKDHEDVGRSRASWHQMQVFPDAADEASRSSKVA